jgi:cell division protease FtsH
MRKARAAEGLPPPGGRPRDEDLLTRKPLSFWDRIKFLVLLGLVWLILTWSVMANDPLVGFSDAVRIEVRAGSWVFILMGLEVIRQIHFLISEHSKAYHRFWTYGVFGGFERLTHRRISDWTRFRLSRLVKWVFWIAVAAVVTGKIIHTTPVLALLRGPQLIWHALPFVLQLGFAFFFIAFQFIGLFWLLSRGGVDVYYPDDIKTRFSDVWGQDTCWSGSRRTSSSWRTPSWSRRRAATCPAACCCGGRQGPARR